MKSNSLKKLLIISYFFPPCNLTAAQRIKGWAEYLNESGFYPIIVTRNWEISINKPEDVLKSCGKKVEHIKHDQYEVYHLPYSASTRDRIYTKHEGSFLQKLSRPLTLLNLIAENYRIQSIPHSNLYDFTRQYLQNNDDIHSLIISGNPFNQFFFGYKLNKEFGVPWIADYRDDWNTSEVNQVKNKLIKKLQTKSEKKWVKTASFITSVSPYYAKKISDFVGVPGHVVLNGFDLDETLELTTKENDFVITYNGSLYSSQPIEPILRAVNRLINEGFSEISFNFPGLAFDAKQEKRVLQLTSSNKTHYHITNRVPKEQVLEIQRKSDLLLMVAHSNLKGIPSSKLYEYIGLRKPILLYPNDNDIIEETLLDTELGIICSNEDDTYIKLKKLLEDKRNGVSSTCSNNHKKINQYSRKEQTITLGKLLDKI